MIVETWCYVANVKNTVNLDICFPDLTDTPDYFSNTKYKETSYFTYNPDDFTRSEEMKTRLYRCRLKGIMFNSGCSEIDAKHSKFTLIRICKMTGCVFRCRIHGIDNYSRLWVELYDPVTNKSVTDQLLRKNPSAVRRFTDRPKR